MIERKREGEKVKRGIKGKREEEIQGEILLEMRVYGVSQSLREVKRYKNTLSYFFSIIVKEVKERDHRGN